MSELQCFSTGPDAGPAIGAGTPFFEDAALASLQSRAMSYLRAGVPVHFRGPAGTGKTTLALRIAARLGRPVTFITGDEWMTRADLVGREVGEVENAVHDTYVARVRRTERRVSAVWEDAPLARAMGEGHTLVYDEFTRASPAANAMLLSALEERVLAFTDPVAGRDLLAADPEFRVILTSNPGDYAGVNAAPDALIDRVVTFRLDRVSMETEAGAVAAATGLDAVEAAHLVGMVRNLRAGASGTAALSMRTSMLIARLLAAAGLRADPANPAFLQICTDVLGSRLGLGSADLASRITEAALPSGRKVA